MGIKGALLQMPEKRCECRRGNTFAPVFFTNPVADGAQPALWKAPDIASHLPVDENGLLDETCVSQNLGPMCYEGRVIPGREGGHLRCVGIELVFKEDG